MKKLQVLAVVVVMMIAANASAQTKIAYIRIDDIVGLMPDLAPTKVNMDTVGQKFIQDSILPRVTYVQNEYQRKLVEYTDTVKNSKQVREQIGKDLQAYQDELSGTESMIQQVQQYKQQELLKPYYARAKKAIDAVAKRKGYTHVVNTDVFLLAPEADDISMAVLAELGIKLPNQNPAAGKPAAKTGN